LLNTLKRYDFRRPDKFSKEHFRALRMVHDSFARLLASFLTSQLRTSVQVREMSVEEVTYGEYIRSLPVPTALYVVTLEPLLGQGVLELDLAVAQAIVDRLLGGSGTPGPRTSDLSEIELGLMKSVGNFFATSLREAWAHVVPLNPTVNEPVFSPEFVQLTLPSEATAKLVFEVNLFQTSGSLSICIPHPVLQPVMDRLTARIWVTGSQRSAAEDTRLSLIDPLKQAPVPLIAELGRTRMSLREILRLASGDIIRLDTAADGDLPIRVGARVKFVGRPGIVNRNLGIRITQVLS
jgi:flagellar motor switch protein FliM